MSQAKNHQAISCTTSDQIIIEGNGGIKSCRFDDIYFHPRHGAEESQYVYLEGNHLDRRWQALAKDQSTFVIGETGFGTGLNFLATWDLWRKTSVKHLKDQPKQTLYYYVTELFPLTRKALTKVLAHYNPYPELAEQLLEQYPDSISGDYLLEFDCEQFRSVKLIFLFGDSCDGLERMEFYPNVSTAGTLKVDAWFLDGFSPPRNPDMWCDQLFSLIARHSGLRTTAATFSVARHVREQLESVGFKINKLPGFGSKREMLSADFKPKLPGSSVEQTTVNNRNITTSPCYFRHFSIPRNTDNKQVLVIGAGIAGCCIAYKLANRGWQVKLAFAEKTVASAASGNYRAVLYARTAQQRSSLSDFHEASFHYAVNFYRSLEDAELASGLNGMIKLDEQLSKAFLADNPELNSRRNVTLSEVEAIAGLASKRGGIYYPHSGWLNPTSICSALSTHPNIELSANTSITGLSRDNNRWKVQTQTTASISSDIVVIAAGQQSASFAQTHWLPLKAIRGQTTQLPSTMASEKLNIAICSQGYITPVRSRKNELQIIGKKPPLSSNDNDAEYFHEIGASYNLNDLSTEINSEDNVDNIDRLIDCLAANSPFAEELTQIRQQQSSGKSLNARVGFRCVSPDYLPLVGPVVNAEQFKDTFSILRKNAKKIPDQLAPLEQGLFVSTGYGSHGFTTAPLATEILLAQIEGLPIPFGDKLRQSIAPARFLVRQLIRGK